MGELGGESVNRVHCWAGGGCLSCTVLACAIWHQPSCSLLSFRSPSCAHIPKRTHQLTTHKIPVVINTAVFYPALPWSEAEVPSVAHQHSYCCSIRAYMHLETPCRRSWHILLILLSSHLRRLR